MRIGRETWTRLHPDDIAWVVEWQLASAFRWMPIGEHSPVYADLAADRSGRSWWVTICAGSQEVRAKLPLRELARVVLWCRGSDSLRDLLSPPAQVSAALRSLRAALQPALRSIDPLDTMGYRGRQPHDLGPTT